jgi:hypothetical protein
MGRKKDDKYQQAQVYNQAAANTATTVQNTADAIPQKTTETAKYLAPRALERIKALDEQGAGALKGYELFDPEQFNERESLRRTGMETLNAPYVNPNYIAGVQEEMKDKRMRDSSNYQLAAFDKARQGAIAESYTAEGDSRNAMLAQMQGQTNAMQGRLGAAGNQTQLAQAHNSRRRWYDPVLGFMQAGAGIASGIG